LIAVSNHPDSPAASGFLDNVPNDNQPRQLSGMADNADYFVGANGLPLLLVFPAELDMEGRYNRLGPYFNLANEVSNTV
jgi:hypothetical protein